MEGPNLPNEEIIEIPNDIVRLREQLAEINSKLNALRVQDADDLAHIGRLIPQADQADFGRSTIFESGVEARNAIASVQERIAKRESQIDALEAGRELIERTIEELSKQPQ